MNIDFYTKFILTVIAVCLVWIGAQRSVGNAVAQGPAVVTIDNELLKVVICNEKNTRCADIAYGGKVEVDVD
jgi:hypothetical protein